MKGKLIWLGLIITTIIMVGCTSNKDKESSIESKDNKNSQTVKHESNAKIKEKKSEVIIEKDKEPNEKNIEKPKGNSNDAKVNKAPVLKEDNTSKSVDNKVSEKEDLGISMFVPNGSYEVSYLGSDLSPNLNYIKGNGKSFETIGTNGKGPFVTVYSIQDNKLCEVYYSSDLTEDEIKNFDYLSKNDVSQKVALLSAPIAVGTRWGNKEIVEVGENLNLDGLILNGPYVKTWEKTKNNESESIKVCYYSKGLGLVKYKVIIGDSVVEYSTLRQFNKR